MPVSSRMPANTLAVTIIVTLLLGIISTSLLLLFYYNRQEAIKYSVEERVKNNLESGIELVLADTTVNSEKRVTRLSLFDSEQDSIVITSELWGIYKVATVRAFANRYSKQKTFFNAPVLNGFLNSCIYLADHKRVLSIVGNTKLSGNVFLSGAGIRPGYINQRGFDNNSFVEGEIKISEPELPSLDSSSIKNAEILLRQIEDTAWIKSHRTDLADEGVFQSFTEPTLNYVCQGPLYLDKINLRGHIIVYSDTKVEVSDKAELDNVIIISPVIIFEKEFKGKVQAIARDSIILKEGCELKYPSSLLLLKRKKETIQSVIRVEGDCKFSGCIIANANPEDIFGNYFEAGKDSHIEGVVYIKGYSSLAGSIYGTVLTDYFIYKTPNVIYEDYIIDTEINRMRLSKHFTGSPIFKTPGKNKIAEWLD